MEQIDLNTLDPANVEALKALEKSLSPCGHLSRFCYTEDGGKTIYCYVCQLADLRAKLETAKADCVEKMAMALRIF